MKILVLSDSHSARSFMRLCVERLSPDAVIHLGDHYDDGQILQEEYPNLRLYQVPGNCDRYRTPPFVQEILIQRVCGVNLYMTHGHIHKVKSGNGALRAAARICDADAVLYGHTHRAECFREDTGMWVMNPGACGSYGGSCGLILVENGTITDCKILTQEDLL